MLNIHKSVNTNYVHIWIVYWKTNTFFSGGIKRSTNYPWDSRPLVSLAPTPSTIPENLPLLTQLFVQATKTTESTRQINIPNPIPTTGWIPNSLKRSLGRACSKITLLTCKSQKNPKTPKNPNFKSSKKSRNFSNFQPKITFLKKGSKNPKIQKVPKIFKNFQP